MSSLVERILLIKNFKQWQILNKNLFNPYRKSSNERPFF